MKHVSCHLSCSWLCTRPATLRPYLLTWLRWPGLKHRGSANWTFLLPLQPRPAAQQSLADQQEGPWLCAAATSPGAQPVRHSHKGHCSAGWQRDVTPVDLRHRQRIVF